MAIEIGRGSHIGLAEESTYGTSVSPTDFIEVRSIGLGLELPRNYFDEHLTSRTVQGYITENQDTSGSIEMYGMYEGLELLFKHALGSVSSSQVGSTSAYEHTFSLSESLPTGLTVYALKGSQAFEYPGCKVATLTLSQEAGQPLMVSAELIGNGVETKVSTETPTYPSWLPIHFGQISTLDINNSEAKVQSFELVITNPFADDIYTLATSDQGTREDIIENGKREIMCNMSVYADGYTLYDLYRDSTEHPVDITYTGSEADGGEDYKLSISLPNVIAEGEAPNPEDMGPISHNFNVRALKNSSNSDELEIKLTNTTDSV